MARLPPISIACAVCAVLLAASPRAAGDRWPQWRGPARTGVLSTDEAPAAWPAELKKGWTVNVGEGYSSPIAGDGRVFIHARRDPEEVVSAIDLTAGTVAWTAKYAAPIEKNPYARQMAKGPYSTPLLAGGRLYTLGTTAILTAWNASTGALVWRRDFSSRVDTSKLFCGTAMSPLMTQHGIVVHVGDDRGGTVMTLDPATGKDKWTTPVKGPGYASPIEITVAGTRQVVTLTTGSVIGVDSATCHSSSPQRVEKQYSRICAGSLAMAINVGSPFNAGEGRVRKAPPRRPVARTPSMVRSDECGRMAA